MSPIPRARNPGGFRPTSSGGTEEDGLSPFGEVMGLVGGWEDKMRSATAWAVVNTTSPATMTVEEQEEMNLEGAARSQGVDVSG